MKKYGNYASQLGLCDVCQHNLYNHIEQHSILGYKEKNYGWVDGAKENIATDARSYYGDDVIVYLANKSESFIRFQQAITFYYDNGGRYLDWAMTLNKLGVLLDIYSTKDAY